MGTLHNIICKVCGAEEGYATGQGMSSPTIAIELYEGNLKTLKWYVSKKLYKTVVNLVKDDLGNVRFQIEDGNFWCPYCYTASHLEQLKISGMKTGEWTQTLICEKCDNKLLPTKKELDSFKCKKCGSLSLQDHYAGEWD